MLPPLLLGRVSSRSTLSRALYSDLELLALHDFFLLPCTRTPLLCLAYVFGVSLISHLFWSYCDGLHNSQIGSDSLVSAREWDTADKYYRSARKDEHSTIVSPNATLNDSTMDRRNTQEPKDELNCINGNSRMSDPQNTKTQTDTVLGLETADWEREPCTWAANKAGE